MNAISLDPGFHGVFQPEELSQCFSSWMFAEELRPLLGQFDNTVFHSSGMSLMDVDGKKHLQVKQVVFIRDGYVFQGNDLLSPPLSQSTMLYLHVGEEIVPMSDQSALKKHHGKVTLQTEESCHDRCGFPFVQVMEENKGHFIIARDFWPETYRISSDWRSRDALERFCGLLPGKSPLLEYFATHWDILSWIDVMPEMIRLLSLRYEANPQRMEALNTAVRQSDTSKLVSSMIRLLQEENDMPMRLERAGKTYRFHSELDMKTATITTREKTTVYDFASGTIGKPKPKHKYMIVVRIEKSKDADVCRSVLRTTNENIQQTILDGEPALMGHWCSGQSLKLELGDEGKLRHIAEYTEDHNS